MPRTFTCWGDRSELGSSHQWTVEDSPLDESYLVLQCPDHDEDPKNEAPYQGADMLLWERLERSQRA